MIPILQQKQLIHLHTSGNPPSQVGARVRCFPLAYGVRSNLPKARQKKKEDKGSMSYHLQLRSHPLLALPGFDGQVPLPTC